MQKIIAINSNSIVQNSIAPINARTSFSVGSVSTVAKIRIEITMTIAAVMMTKGEYLRRLEQVEVRTTSAVLPHLAFRTAVIANNIMARTST